MTDAELEAIEKACAEATPGPWTVNHPSPRFGTYSIAQCRAAEDEPTARFIEGSRSWVPALVAEVRRLRVIALEHENLCPHVTKMAHISGKGEGRRQGLEEAAGVVKRALRGWADGTCNGDFDAAAEEVVTELQALKG